jgi:N-acetylglucosamine-6-phosphate deacetylase
MIQYLAAKYIFDGVELLENKAIRLVNNQLEIVNYNNNLINCKYLGNGVISSGFIDLQINGCGGVLFNDNISIDTLLVMQKTCIKFGTTYFMPTLITTGFSDIKKALAVVDEWIGQYGKYNGVVGLHLEGPFISSKKTGIHQKDYIIKPKQEILDYIVSYATKFPILMTIAPEEFTNNELQYLSDKQIILSIGHSNATYQEVIDKIAYGITSVTHLFNAMTGLSSREPGVVGATLNSNLYAGIIADLLHVSSANIEIVHKLKSEFLYLVTDAVTPMGNNEISQFSFAGKQIFVKDGKCQDENGVLAGANITLPDAIKNCFLNCHIPLQQVLKMVTTNPAKVIGLHEQIGYLNSYNSRLIYMSLDDYNCIILI